MRNNWIHWLIISLILVTCCLPHLMVAQPSVLFSQINSDYDEQFPVLSPDGQSLYFVRDRHPNNMGVDNLPDIWESRRKTNNAWGPCIHMGLPINDLKSNLLVGVNIAGNTFYLAETDGYQSWINLTHRQGRRWTLPQSMIIDQFVPGAAATFSVSPDEQILLIASQQPDGLGSMDLYLSFRTEERRWSPPIHLDTTLNTPGKESWAMLAADGQTLYFASDGHPGGIGGLDLWMSRRINGSWQEWTTPVNLGSSINTLGDEVSMAVAGEGNTAIIARLTSLVDAPQAGKTQSDLQQINLLPDHQPFTIAILSGQLLDAQIKQTKTGKVFYRLLGTESAKEQPLNLQENGAYKVIVPLNRGIAFYGNLPGYLPLSDRFDKIPLAGQLDTPNPQIAAWAGMNTFYWQEEKVIHNSQNQLQLIQDKKEILGRENKVHRQLLAEKTYNELENEKVFPPDPEIEALERRFNIYHRRMPDTLSLLTNQNKKQLPDQPKGTSGGESKKEYIEEPLDEETLKLKKEFREHRSASTSPVSTLLKGEDYVDIQVPFSFQDLKKRAEKEITYAMLPRVQAELVQELFSLAWRPLQQSTSATILKNLTEREDSIRIQIRQGLGQFILAPDRFQTTNKEDSEWWQQLKADLKNVLRQQIRAQLKQNLRPYVFKAIQLELDYQVVLSMEESQRKMLTYKIEQQNKIETSSEEVGLYLDQVPVSISSDMPPDDPKSFIEIKKDLLLTPIKEGGIIELKNVRFLPDTPVLALGSNIELDSILQFLKANKEIRVDIQTHTHGWCDHAKANELTHARARLLSDYFTMRGISRDRVKYTGMGKTQPRTDNESLPGRAANQRIELKMLGIDKYSME